MNGCELIAQERKRQKAGALIAAEIDRQQRIHNVQVESSEGSEAE